MDTENETLGYELPKQQQILEINTEIGEQLKSAARWAQFLAILGFVFIGLMIFAGFIMSIVFSVIGNEISDNMPFPSFLFGLMYLVMGAIYLLPVLYLYRFSAGIKKALLQSDQNQLGKAFTNLKAHYRFIGIFTIVIFALYFVAMFIMIFVGVFAGLASGISGLTA